MTFDWRGGVHLVGSDLWFDAPRARGLNFVAHAGIKVSGARVFCSEITAKGLRRLGRRTRPLAAPFGHPVTFGAHRVELLRSDLLPGAAQLRVDHEQGAALYAGWIGGLAEPRDCDVLCLRLPESTGGESIASIIEAARGGEALPILLASALPEAYTVAWELLRWGIKSRAHPRLHVRLRAVGLFAVPVFRGTLGDDEALLWPRDVRPSAAVAGLRRPHIVVGSVGASLETMAGFARATGAREIVLVGPGATAVARRLSNEGLLARPIARPDQLDLFEGRASA